MSDTKNMSLLERRFTFYASYHNNPVNQWIHIVCVPVIFWSALVLGAYIPVESLLNAIGQSSTEPLCTLGPLVVPRNVATLAVIVYMVYYLILSRLLGVSFSFFNRLQPQSAHSLVHDSQPLCLSTPFFCRPSWRHCCC